MHSLTFCLYRCRVDLLPVCLYAFGKLHLYLMTMAAQLPALTWQILYQLQEEPTHQAPAHSTESDLKVSINHGTKTRPTSSAFTVMVAKSHPNFCSIFKIFMPI